MGAFVSAFGIRIADLSDGQTRDLLALHFRGMHESSPPGTCYVLDISGIQSPDVTLWSAWDGDHIVSIGALKMLGTDGRAAEIKSMRTHPDFLRRGAAAQMLSHLIAVARARRIRHLSLETGTSADYAAAVALYTRFGFVVGDVFADYTPSPHNQFLHLDL